MSYKLYTHKDAICYTPYAQVQAVFGYPREITNITIHWWGLPEWKQTTAGVVSFFCDGNPSTSAHEVISAGEVYILVDHMNAAWANGNSKGNAQSISLECNPRMSREDFETVAERVADIWKLHERVIPLTEHRDWFSTMCCGTWKKADITARALEYYNGKTGKANVVAQVANKIVNEKKGTPVADALNEAAISFLPGAAGVRNAGHNYVALQNISAQTQQIKDAITPGVPSVKFEGDLYKLVRQLHEESRRTNELLTQLVNHQKEG